MLSLENAKIAVIGLGYVGLPLAVEFGKSIPTMGFDVNIDRITQLKGGVDITLETNGGDLAAAQHLTYTHDASALARCNTYIVTVPTPIDRHKRPDISILKKASDTVGRVISKGDVVIYESTVYPGATEEDCIPIIEQVSGLTFNVDFFAGYSPERINPGDKQHRLSTITKVTSGSTPEAANYIDALYSSIIIAGTHKASSIKVAEAAKVIENTQRDVNIALMNELALIFERLGINTLDVLTAAETKWNFLPFRPGLVGGHCIGVDPYYLTHKAQETGYQPEVVLAGRRINDRMGATIAHRFVRDMIRKDVPIKGGRVLILGLTFKENCPDLRNTRVIDIVEELQSYGMQVDVRDPWVTVEDAKAEYNIDLIESPQAGTYDGVLLAVAHGAFKDAGAAALHAYGKENHVFFDIKGIFTADESDAQL